MNLALRTFAVYCKLALAGAVGVLVAVVVWMNSDNRVNFWLLRTHEQVNVLYIILITAITSIVVFWILLKIRGVLRDLRGVRAEKLKAEAAAAQQRQAAELAAREKRLDEKLRRSITEDAS